MRAIILKEKPRRGFNMNSPEWNSGYNTSTNPTKTLKYLRKAGGFAQIF